MLNKSFTGERMLNEEVLISYHDKGGYDHSHYSH